MNAGVEIVDIADCRDRIADVVECECKLRAFRESRVDVDDSDGPCCCDSCEGDEDVDFVIGSPVAGPGPIVGEVEAVGIPSGTGDRVPLVEFTVVASVNFLIKIDIRPDGENLVSGKLSVVAKRTTDLERDIDRITLEYFYGTVCIGTRVGTGVQ